MRKQTDKQSRKIYTGIRNKKFLTGIFLFLENLTAALWQPLSWFLFFAGLWLLNIPAFFGEYGPAGFAIIFYAGLFLTVFRNIRYISLPSREAINRRLELDNHIRHRPLTTIEDRPAHPGQRDNPSTEKLWNIGMEKAAQGLSKLRITPPHPVASKLDPAAFRALAFIVFIIGVVVSGPSMPSRLFNGAFPFAGQIYAGDPDTMTVWITPPEYTGYEQFVIQGDTDFSKPLDIPAGSTVKARINTGFFNPVMIMGDVTYRMEKLGRGSWGLEQEIKQGELITIKQWLMQTSKIPYRYLNDAPPDIKLTAEPVAQDNGQLRIPLKLYDDYGVEELKINVTLDKEARTPPAFGKTYNETRSILSPAEVELDIAPVYNLAWHPWAGMPVVIKLTAQDGQDQTAALPPIHITLPEREFQHPVARKLIDMRKRLIWTPQEAAPNISHEIESVMASPAAYQDDIVAFLAMRSAASRLAYNDDMDSVRAVIVLLWDTALKIEDGNLPMAARNLQNTRQALEDLLNNPDAQDEQIAVAVDELRQAMAEYLTEFYREMQKRMSDMEQAPMMSPQSMENVANLDDLAAFLDRLQAEAMTGNKDAAREMLSQLQQFMDMMNTQGSFETPPQMEFMAEGINELQELIERQQELLEQTKEQSKAAIRNPEQYYPEFDLLPEALKEQFGFGNMPPPPSPEKQAPEAPQTDINTDPHKVEQDALRYILGQLMMESSEMLGQIPEPMQKAEKEMRRSGRFLGQNAPAQSVTHQEKAIEHLQDAMNSMSQQMQAMMQQMTGFTFGRGPVDPLGRPMQEGQDGNMFSGSRVKIPDEARRKRVKEILDLLRRRSGELRRPEYELEYYRRLMKQF